MMKKAIILLVTAITISVFGQYNQPENAWEYQDVKDKEFLTDSRIWKAYAKANLEYFRKINNPNHNICGDKEKVNLVRALSNEGYGNIKFQKMKNTDVFYSSEDKFRCEMNLSILKHEFPMAVRRKLREQGKEDPDAFYWTTAMIATRWQIAAQSLKECGIRIKEISLTTFETQTYSPDKGLDPFTVPTLYLPSQRSNHIISSLIQDDELLKKRSVKMFYTGEAPPKDPKYNLATAAADLAENDDPAMRSFWLKRMSIASPVFPPKLNPNDTGYVDELHELYHILTGKKDEECHFDPRKLPNKFGPMSDTIMNQGGKFDPLECEDMRKLGEKSKLLTCYPERPFQPSPDKE